MEISNGQAVVEHSGVYTISAIEGSREEVVRIWTVCKENEHVSYEDQQCLGSLRFKPRKHHTHKNVDEGIGTSGVSGDED